MSKKPLFTIITLLMTSLSGCTVFPDHEPPRVMDLTLQSLSYQTSDTQNHSLRIDTPYASEPFNSTRILAKPNAWEFRIYEGVRWRDTAPVIVRDLLVQAVRASRGFTHVVNDTSPAEADWSLIAELSGFHTESHAGSVSAVIRLHARILDNRSRDTLCAKGFEADQPLKGPAIEQVVEGFSSAGSALAESVSRWAAECAPPVIQETDQARPLSDTAP